MIRKGFRFGMLLQLAVGPMSLMVFQTATGHGLPMAMLVVLAITLVDTAFICLSGMGAAALLKKSGVQRVVKCVGCIVLALFGANMITGAFGISLLPEIALFSKTTSGNIFLQGLLLTASNPMTILFWSGVFSTQIIAHHMNRPQLIQYGAGCALSTLLCQTLVAVLGTLLGGFLQQGVMQVLNVLVGLALIYFGVRLLVKKEEAEQVPPEPEHPLTDSK